MKTVWNKETRRPEDNVYYRVGDWGVQVEDDFSDSNFTEVAPPQESLEHNVPCDWNEATGAWVLDTAENDRRLALDTLTSTDIPMVRGIEDLVDVLVAKGVIAMSDLPQALQDRIATRKNARNDL